MKLNTKSIPFNLIRTNRMVTAFQITEAIQENNYQKSRQILNKQIQSIEKVFHLEIHYVN